MRVEKHTRTCVSYGFVAIHKVKWGGRLGRMSRQGGRQF